MSSWMVHQVDGRACRADGGISGLKAIVSAGGVDRTIVTVSAEKDITALLLSLVHSAMVREEKLWGRMEELRENRFSMLAEMVPAPYREDVEAVIRQDFQDLEDIIRAIWLVGDCSERTRHYISSLGAVWISKAVAARMRTEGFDVRYADASTLLVMRFSESGPEVCWEPTRSRLEQFFHKNSSAKLLLLPGGLASLEEGGIINLPLNGAEFCAAICANLTDAVEVRIWTDVDGVMSADPEKVPGAEVIPELTYQEATELAFFGADILHPPAMTPAMMKQIPIRISNFSFPGGSGTLISGQKGEKNGRPVKGFSIIRDICLLNIEGAGMIGVPGISGRLFKALNGGGISVILISQASSEHSICCAIPESQGESAKVLAREAFASELETCRISSIEVENGCAILAAVGDQMSGIPGIAASFFGALGKARVNVRAIAQGSSERNISAVIDASDSTRALRAVHAGFYLSSQSLSIGIIGPGLIGSTLIGQIAGESGRLRDIFNVDLRVRGITDSRKMTLAETGIAIRDWKKALTEDSEPADIERFVDHVAADYFPHSVIIDCTTSSDLPRNYTSWLDRGIHIITPNKKAGTAPWDEYVKMMSCAKDRKRHFLYETTVGAGLPIIGTLRDLIQTGDRILSIEGVFSGTLAYLFWRFDGTAPFSSLVAEAKELGFTEPDPRDDLSGMDIVRKTVILAREIGYPVEVEQVPVKSLVPSHLESVAVDQFMDKLTDMDDEMDRLFHEAKAQNRMLKYVGAIDEKGNCRVELKAYPMDHAFARISGSDNIVAFTTDRYKTQPLVVQGPGAGPDVTAGGIFADLLRLASYLGAKL
jgi:bifunctional aspartokinase / homoserine dehydrogenase 1